MGVNALARGKAVLKDKVKATVRVKDRARCKVRVEKEQMPGVVKETPNSRSKQATPTSEQQQHERGEFWEHDFERPDHAGRPQRQEEQPALLLRLQRWQRRGSHGCHHESP